MSLFEMRQALYLDAGGAEASVLSAFAEGAIARLAFPFEDLGGGAAFWGVALAELRRAFPDVERREFICITGEDEQGATWVGCGGHYMGNFRAPFLEIAPTGRLASMRFHEFFRIEGGQVVEMQALWDIPDLMMQAGAWPMAPSLGRELCTPSPATQDGLGPHPGARSEASKQHVIDMLDAMQRHPLQGGPEVMEMPKYWHPKFNWYGPSGIGTSRGIQGFREFHQIPFLAAMPDRGAHGADINIHFMAEGDYVGVTGWPDMKQTISQGGWMGIAPAGVEIEMRSLDFWRLENGLIRENWVLVDLLSVYDQIGVDVFARMKEFCPWSNV